MDLSVASSLHGNKITADKDLEKSLSLKSEILQSLLCMLVLVTTEITQIHGWIEHHNIYKTSLLIMLKIGTDHMVAT